MELELKTIMGKLFIIGGRTVEGAPNMVAVREPSSWLGSRPPRGNLFALVELRGEPPRPEAIEENLVGLARDTYYGASGSVTASLRRAMQAANGWLYRYNLGCRPEDRALAGISLVAVRGADVFIAQVGPCAVFVTNGVFLRRYPASSGWLDSPDGGSDEPALGIARTVNMTLSHVQLGVGDILLLTDTQLPDMVSIDRLERAVAHGDIERTLDNLAKLVGSDNCVALAVQLVPDDGRGKKRAFIPPAPKKTSRPSQFQSRPQPQPQSPRPAQPRRERVQGAPVAEGTSRGTTRRGDGPVSARAVAPSPLSAAAKKLKGVQVAGLLAGAGVMLKRVLPGDDEAKPARPTRPARATLSSEATGSRASARPRVRAKPARREVVGQAQKPARPDLLQNVLRFLAIGIPVIAILLILFMSFQRGRSRENEYNALLTQAGEKYQQALGADPVAARGLLGEAEAFLAQAQEIKSGDEQVASLLEQIGAKQDEVNNVERLYWIAELKKYDAPGTQLKRVVVNSLDVYVLDAGLDRVYHHRLDEMGDTLLPDGEGTLLVERGQQVGDAVVGEIIDMVWMVAGGGRQTSDLLILESGGLLEYNPSWGITTSAIGGTELWQTPGVVSSFFGNLYVLDGGAGQVGRYLPTTDGYSGIPEMYFPAETAPNMATVVDMAIDGDVYLLYLDGTIKKYRRGEEVPFAVTNLDRPFLNPGGIFAAPDEEAKFIYVADAGNQRVVQLNKDGLFVRQFKPRDEEGGIVFDDLREIFVDEIGGKLYALNGSSLYAANLPTE